MNLHIYTDGGSLNNPGQAAIAYAVFSENQLVTKSFKRIGLATNNVAEYSALIEALGFVKTIINTVKSVRVFSDSLLMINQLNGLYKMKDAGLRELLMKVRILESELNIPVSYIHVLREKNQLTDSLVKKALGK